MQLGIYYIWQGFCWSSIPVYPLLSIEMILATQYNIQITELHYKSNQWIYGVVKPCVLTYCLMPYCPVPDCFERRGRQQEITKWEHYLFFVGHQSIYSRLYMLFVTRIIGHVLLLDIIVGAPLLTRSQPSVPRLHLLSSQNKKGILLKCLFCN